MLELTMFLSFLLQNYFNVYIIGALLIVNAVIGFAQEQKASGAVESLRKRLQINARVLRDGKWQTVSAKELVPGDIVRVRAGDFVPADLKVTEGSELGVDQSALTGRVDDCRKERGRHTLLRRDRQERRDERSRRGDRRQHILRKDDRAPSDCEAKATHGGGDLERGQMAAL